MTICKQTCFMTLTLKCKAGLHPPPTPVTPLLYSSENSSETDSCTPETKRTPCVNYTQPSSGATFARSSALTSGRSPSLSVRPEVVPFSEKPSPHLASRAQLLLLLPPGWLVYPRSPDPDHRALRFRLQAFPISYLHPLSDLILSHGLKHQLQAGEAHVSVWS